MPGLVVNVDTADEATGALVRRPWTLPAADAASLGGESAPGRPRSSVQIVGEPPGTRR